MKIRNLVAGCGVLLAGQVGAQVPCDDCSGALANVVPLALSWHCDLGQQNLGFGFPQEDSTDAATVNFPYPLNPGTCTGFAGSLTTPGKDLWWAFTVQCHLEVSITVLDSASVSFWIGGSCSSLYPVDCATLLPGQSTTLFPYLPNTWQDTVLVQLASTGPNTDVRFDACFKNPAPWCDPSGFEWNGPTPIWEAPLYVPIIGAQDIAFPWRGNIEAFDVLGRRIAGTSISTLDDQGGIQGVVILRRSQGMNAEYRKIIYVR
jgi:hypothetical protein